MAKYNTPLWVNPLDGRHDIIESPVWMNELSASAIEDPSPPKSTVQTIDFTFPWDGRDELVYPTNHRNARPFIQNPHRPSMEPGEIVTVNEILRKRDDLRLQDYFRQLHGLLGGTRWIVLVPDDWESQWLERVIRAQPPSFTRDKMFLLWRSVAAALGMLEERKFKDQESLIIADGYAVPFYNAVELRFMKERETGRILPQRSSTRLHSSKTPGCKDVRFFLGCSFSDQASVYGIGGRSVQRLGIGRLSSANFVGATDSFAYTHSDKILFDGVRRFLKDESEGLVSYFDERDALSLVIQNRAEEVEFKTLVEHDECSPGGKPYKGKWTRGGALQMGASKLALNLLEGEPRDDELLKEMLVVLDQKTPETTDIFFEAEMTPGQGLASVMFMADFLEKPLPIDLTGLKVSENTKSRIEKEMKRHFPPVMPLVEASQAIWNGKPSGCSCTIAESVHAYLDAGEIPPADTFAHAQPYWGVVDPTGKTSHRRFGVSRYFDEATMSPVDKLKRENVFGNAPTHRTPNDTGVDWGRLFKQLAVDCKNGKKVLRLIAWSYQYDSAYFEFLRKAFYERYVNWSGDLEIMEITFCANNFAPGDKRISGLLSEVLARIGSGNYKQEELRLAYNLMQFHPEGMEDQDSEICEKAMKRLAYDYNRYPFWKGGDWGGVGATKAAGYYLKCMLFLLHRRRFDPGFLHCPESWTPRGFLGEHLPTKTEALKNHEQTRIAFVNYVRGHGTIEGIPLGD